METNQEKWEKIWMVPSMPPSLHGLNIKKKTEVNFAKQKQIGLEKLFDSPKNGINFMA